MTRFRMLTAALLLVLLAACRPQTGEELRLPTPIRATSPAATALPATALAQKVAAPTATSQPPTPLPATTATTIPVTSVPTATALTAAPPVTDVESAGAYRVAYVELGDTLNLRSGPGTTYPVIAELPPDTDGLTMDASGHSLVGGSTWAWVEGAGAAGWVNSRFLTEEVADADFCGDPAVEAVLAGALAAIAARDGTQLASLVHSERGLRLRQAWWNEEILIPGEDVAGLFNSNTIYDWGIADGSGLPIQGTFREVLLPLLDRDLIPAAEGACNELIHGPTAGMTILPEAYQPVPFLSLYRVAPEEMEFDWGTWAVGIERWEGDYYLSYFVHYDYEI